MYGVELAIPRCPTSNLNQCSHLCVYLFIIIYIIKITVWRHGLYVSWIPWNCGDGLCGGSNVFIWSVLHWRSAKWVVDRPCSLHVLLIVLLMLLCRTCLRQLVSLRFLAISRRSCQFRNRQNIVIAKWSSRHFKTLTHPSSLRYGLMFCPVYRRFYSPISFSGHSYLPSTFELMTFRLFQYYNLFLGMFGPPLACSFCRHNTPTVLTIFRCSWARALSRVLSGWWARALGRVLGGWWARAYCSVLGGGWARALNSVLGGRWVRTFGSAWWAGALLSVYGGDQHVEQQCSLGRRHRGKLRESNTTWLIYNPLGIVVHTGAAPTKRYNIIITLK